MCQAAGKTNVRAVQDLAVEKMPNLEDPLLLFRFFPEVGGGRFGPFSLIFIFWRWLFTLLGGG